MAVDKVLDEIHQRDIQNRNISRNEVLTKNERIKAIYQMQDRIMRERVRAMRELRENQGDQAKSFLKEVKEQTQQRSVQQERSRSAQQQQVREQAAREAASRRDAGPER